MEIKILMGIWVLLLTIVFNYLLNTVGNYINFGGRRYPSIVVLVILAITLLISVA